jgi:Zn-dependent protease
MPLGRVLGVTIRVHFTFFVLVALVAVTAADVNESAIEAVGWLVALFACVVVHELAHAVVARSKGIAVHEIDLLPIGGVSRLERIPDDWRDEAAIAVVGPIASLVLAVVAFLLAAVAGLHLLPVSFWDGPFLVRLAWVNLLLAAFNLVPAFPLDGGRVLRALLERSASRPAATHQAVQISRVLAAVMIAVGLLFNVWLLLIGVFVLFAGAAEEAAVLVHTVLGPVRADALAVPCPVVFDPATTAGQAAVVAARTPQAAFPVVASDGHFVGLVTAGALHGAIAATRVRDLVIGQVVEADRSLEDVTELSSHEPVAVLSDGDVVGVISIDDVRTFLNERLRQMGG